MNRDHLLGWPPSLLALDEVEPTCHRRPAATAASVPVTRTRLSQAEQDQRAARDRNATAMLDAPPVPPADRPKYLKYYRHADIEGLWYRLDQDGSVHIGNGSPSWRRAQWTADKLFTPAVAEITEDELPAHLRTHKALATPSIEYRVRKNESGIYRLRDGQVEYWNCFYKRWYPPIGVRDWNDMVPAPESAIAALPAEAHNT